MLALRRRLAPTIGGNALASTSQLPVLPRLSRPFANSSRRKGQDQLRSRAYRDDHKLPPIGLAADDAHSTARHRIHQIDQIDAARPDAVPPSPFLRDRFHRQHTYLRMSLTERCNLRCLYCMPEDGVPLTPNNDLLTAHEVQRIAALFVDQGVNKIRLTGGEPTVRRDLIDIVSSFNDLKPNGLQQIGITSNGISLTRKLDGLVTSGLTHLNISLDTLDPFKFEFMTRRPGFGAVIKSIDRALELAVQSLKLNVVVIRGVNDTQDLLDFVEFTRDKPLTVRFIEYMPFDGNKWQVRKLVPYKDLIATIRTKHPDFARTASKDDANDTSKHWQVPGFKGTVGFITSMTDNFCGTCNRLRVTADGNLKVCLFGNAEVSLRDAMRHGYDAISPLILGSPNPVTDEQLLHIIGAAVGRKHAKHAGMKDPSSRMSRRPSSNHLTARRGSLDSRTRNALFAPADRRGFSTSLSHWTSRTDDGGGDDGPWGDLDAAFDKLSRPNVIKLSRSAVFSTTPAPKTTQQYDFEEAIFAQAGAAAVSNPLSSAVDMANMVPGNQIGGAQSPHFNQPWSEYMGSGEQGDDSPWASLDAFADQSFEANPVAAPARWPSVHQDSDVRSTPRFHLHPDSSHQPAEAEGFRTELTPLHHQQQQQRPGSYPSIESSYGHQVAAQGAMHASRPEDHPPPRLTHVDPGSGRASMVDVGHKASTRRSATANGRVYLPASAMALIRQADGSDKTSVSASGTGALTKGPVLHTAQLAGIMAAKKTSDLIPLCHGLSLSHVDVKLHLVETASERRSAEQTDSPFSATSRGPTETAVTGFTPDQLDDPDSWMSSSSGDECASASASVADELGYIDISCTASTSGQTGVEMEALTGCTVACLTIWDMVKAVAGREIKIGDIKVVAKRGGKSGDWTRTVD